MAVDNEAVLDENLLRAFLRWKLLKLLIAKGGNTVLEVEV